VNNPIYIAEEFAMLDVMSKGRLIAGFVRGIGSEYHSSGVNPYFSHARFHEAHDLIIRAWTEPGPFAFHGDHFSLQYVNLWPRPYQQPHPPVWIPSQGSSETVAWAADPARKYPLLVTFSSGDLVARYHLNYREQARQYGYEAGSEQLGWACPIYVADSDERALAEAGPAVETLFNDFLRQTFEMLMPPGYTSMRSMKNFINMRRGLLGGGRATAQGLIDSGTALIGSPKTVLAGIERMREKTGFGILVTLLQFGTLSDELTRRNMDRFAADVMPHLRD
jgi:alkanesulfonate monooxygenase SsuD/methylene tetrahydromethanopterin reductase-like flavin-dependent oxidoreductase (luciferase family)